MESFLYLPFLATHLIDTRGHSTLSQQPYLPPSLKAALATEGLTDPQQYIDSLFKRKALLSESDQDEPPPVIALAAKAIRATDPCQVAK